MLRLPEYDHRRYWLVDGWSIRFRVAEIAVTSARPYGVKYAFTLHDVDGTRLPGFDNAHGISRCRRMQELVASEFRGADELICDFFAAIESACRQEGVPFAFAAAEVG